MFAIRIFSVADLLRSRITLYRYTECSVIKLITVGLLLIIIIFWRATRSSLMPQTTKNDFSSAVAPIIDAIIILYTCYMVICRRLFLFIYIYACVYIYEYKCVKGSLTIYIYNKFGGPRFKSLRVVFRLI